MPPQVCVFLFFADLVDLLGGGKGLGEGVMQGIQRAVRAQGFPRSGILVPMLRPRYLRNHGHSEEDRGQQSWRK